MTVDSEARGWTGWRDFARGLAVAVAAGVVLALTGAFGSGETPLGLRLAYWVPLMVLGGLWGHLCSIAVCRLIDPAERPWLASALMTALISGPLVVAVWGVTGWIFRGEGLPLSDLPYYLGPVVLITAVMSVLNVFLSRAATVQTHAAAPGHAPARFLDRLPPRLRGATLIAVQAEDHYLRLHTDRGSDLILMRLSDAVVELEGLEGARTHRSWWVAKGAVRGVSRGDGRAMLTLDGGLNAPVSRTHARHLRAQGWY